MEEYPKICLPKNLSAEKLEEAAENAVKERPGNAPDVGMLADAVNLLADKFGDVAIEEHDLHIATSVMLTRKMWRPGRELTVGWFRDEFTEDDALREKIRYFVNSIERYSSVGARFVGFNNVEEADIRIDAKRDWSSWSYVGPDVLSIPGDRPTLHLGWLEHDMDPVELRRVVKHEWFHTLGIEHEQSHPHNDREYDKPYVYHYFQTTQGWDAAETDRQFFRLLTLTGTTFNDYDPTSIAHYPVPREFLLDKTQAVGWNTDLSDGDKAFLRKIYS